MRRTILRCLIALRFGVWSSVCDPVVRIWGGQYFVVVDLLLTWKTTTLFKFILKIEQLERQYIGGKAVRFFSISFNQDWWKLTLTRKLNMTIYIIRKECNYDNNNLILQQASSYPPLSQQTIIWFIYIIFKLNR
jgi:hypothetical protein